MTDFFTHQLLNQEIATLSKQLPQVDSAHDATLINHWQTLNQHIVDLIQEKKSAGKSLTFCEWMEAVLYTPQLGYYMSPNPLMSEGHQTNTNAGDFVTAPALTDAFGFCIADAIAPKLGQTKSCYEFGAGRGIMARQIIKRLSEQSRDFKNYVIIERSAHLRAAQEATLRDLPSEIFNKIIWIDTLPDKLNGVVVGNELIDAFAAEIIRKTASGYDQATVEFSNTSGYTLAWQKPDAALQSAIDKTPLQNLELTADETYITEINTQAHGWLGSILDRLSGDLLLIDYGFPSHTYYHPERRMGTLMCHYKQMTHANPFAVVGLQDITTHVDFTAIAETALEHHAKVRGFCSQADFLVQHGILTYDNKFEGHALHAYHQALKLLLMPHEMGELFQVMHIEKNNNNEVAPMVAASVDRRNRL